MSELPVTDPANIPTTLSEKVESVEWLTPLEQCDVCEAQSYFMVSFEAGELFLCKHHYMKHEEAIFEKALDVVDESELLVSNKD